MTNKEYTTKRGRPKTFDRDKTIELAMLKYWQDGLEASSLNDVCSYTEVSKPGLYREFGGEDGLMESVLDRYHEQVMTGYLSMLQEDRAFRDVFHDLVEWMTTEHDTPAGCLFVKMRSVPERLGVATTKVVESMKEEMHHEYKAWYLRGLERHEVRRIDPDLAAYYIDVQLMTLLKLVAAREPVESIKAFATLAFNSLLESSESK